MPTSEHSSIKYTQLSSCYRKHVQVNENFLGVGLSESKRKAVFDKEERPRVAYAGLARHSKRA